MQKRVQRKEVDVKVSIASSPVSAKLPAGAPSPSRQSISKASAAAYQLPDPNDIAQRYGLPPDNTDEADNAALAIAQEHSSKIAEYDAIVSAMRQKVDEKNRKIEQLCVLLEALEPVPGVDPTRVQAIVTQRVGEDEIDLRDGKIVSLAKKSHRLTQQLNKEKATNDRLTQDLEEYRRRCDVLTQEVDLLRTANAAHNKTETKNYNRHSLVQQGKKDDEEQSAAQIQRTLRDNAKSMEEMKSRIKELSEENKGLARALQRELGDGVSLEQAVDGGWRGRAQQIIMLKSKVKNLEATIQQYQQQGSGGGPSGRSNASVSSYNTQSNYNNNTTSNVDAKACEDIQEMSRERRQVVEALTEERVRLVEQNQQLEKKNQATKARVSILENEIKKLKESLTVRLFSLFIGFLYSSVYQ